MAYQSNLPQITQRMRQATSAGLLAAAAVVETKVKDGLRGGYGKRAEWPGPKSPTGNVMASVNHSEPEFGAEGAFILVGTDVMYALYWELGFWKWPAYFSEKLQRWVSVKGFRNQREWKRKEIWVPAFYGSRVEMMAAYDRAYKAALGGGGAGGFGSRAASPRSPR